MKTHYVRTTGTEHLRKQIAVQQERLRINPFTRLLLDPRIVREAQSISSTRPGRVIAGDPHGFAQDIGTPASIAARCYDIIRSALVVQETDIGSLLEALETLLHQIRDIKKYTMPLNTTRVMVALLRNAMNNAHDRRQLFDDLEMFKESLKGSPDTIRKLLHKLNLMELPEKETLRDVDIAWDDGVYDSATTGRKSILQILMDAYVKGLSSVTITHTNSFNLPSIKLGLEAARILGIQVHFSLEFSVGPAQHRQNYIVYLPHCDTVEDYVNFVKGHRLADFFRQLNEQSKEKNKMLERQIDRFNEHYLQIFNQGYEKSPELCIKPLRFDELSGEHTFGGLSRIHLGINVYHQYRDVLQQRIDTLRETLPLSRNNAEKKALNEQIEHLRHERSQLTVNEIVDRFFQKNAGYDYDAILSDLSLTFQSIRANGGDIILAQPLANGLGESITAMIKQFPAIQGIEIYNTRLYFKHHPAEHHDLIEVVNLINAHQIEPLRSLLTTLATRYNIALDREMIEEFLSRLSGSDFLLKTVMRSDSNGYHPIGTPGMGFFINPSPQNTLRNSASIPVSLLATPSLELPAGYQHAPAAVSVINTFPVETEKPQPDKYRHVLTLRRVFHYPNPWIRNTLTLGIGVAAATMIGSGSIGLPFVGTWFMGSILNYFLSDMVGEKNYDPRNWQIHHFNMTNASTSLLYTGFGIAMLKIVDSTIKIYAGDLPGFAASYLTALGILTAKGAFEYFKALAMGNDTTKAKWGFGRMFISAIPLTIFQSSIGPAIPRLIQVKLWDEIVKHIISISFKFRDFTRSRQHDYQKLIGKLENETDADKQAIAFLDLLYIWKEMPRGQIELKKYILAHPPVRDHLIAWSCGEDPLRILNDPKLDPAYKKLKDKLSSYLGEFHHFLASLAPENQKSGHTALILQPLQRLHY